MATARRKPAKTRKPKMKNGVSKTHPKKTKKYARVMP